MCVRPAQWRWERWSLLLSNSEKEMRDSWEKGGHWYLKSAQHASVLQTFWAWKSFNEVRIDELKKENRVLFAFVRISQSIRRDKGSNVVCISTNSNLCSHWLRAICAKSPHPMVAATSVQHWSSSNNHPGTVSFPKSDRSLTLMQGPGGPVWHDSYHGVTKSRLRKHLVFCFLLRLSLAVQSIGILVLLLSLSEYFFGPVFFFLQWKWWNENVFHQEERVIDRQELQVSWERPYPLQRDDTAWRSAWRKLTALLTIVAKLKLAKLSLSLWRFDKISQTWRQSTAAYNFPCWFALW